MISVNVEFIGSEVKSIMVSGHAESDEYGKDLVCAAVSAIVIGGINALEKYQKYIRIVQEENLLGVEVLIPHQEIQMILQTILIQLQTIADSYQKNIKIKHGGV